MSAAPLPAGSMIGIIGGGQLGRMLAMAAARLGYRVTILDPDAGCPAAQVAGETIVASYDDTGALGRLASQCDVVTYEFENVPVEPVRAAIGAALLHPPAEALEVAQDRVVEKAFLNGIDVETAEWRAIDTVEELGHALLDLGGDCILKTRRFGYDGKGQAIIRPSGPYADAFESLGSVPSILEKKVPFAYECSVIAARGTDGTVVAYDPAENVHSLGILRRSTVPGRLTQSVADAAKAIASRIADRLGYVGVIGVEFFVLADDSLRVNEIAPRVHNSGHWTEAACAISQFEQHVRAIAGLPLGDPGRHSDCVMENLIGDEIGRVAELLGEPETVVHLYGKAEARPGRKMGHFTRLSRR
ncbi:5-(carboxyamino)imidazole ribonucleotide synthase [Aurantimonas endophytica]|uniref:N5-carboxyaminoimidazole ribonucleotide synthase n=1 Tax=Aurantimonas endophytica TaxID=1522175 RepID=A0A7W6HFB8_9HYPH|nr:5-(carboxyamino)imidazole ribonucleotide synthase [Aurantimonas endophytica]MBB4003957.1 5-(carboxyamino)imidazole ribonucleotide synthase [Aurantimonas endophytica]MCO6404807.1 5-(carboxyamino)imidazole ribonucleotide synthase [Aurantimonas endophytica]